MDGTAERLIFRLYNGDECWMTADVTNMPFCVLEPLAVDPERDGCRIEFKKVRFRCSGTPQIEDEVWLLAGAGPVDGEEDER